MNNLLRVLGKISMRSTKVTNRGVVEKMQGGRETWRSRSQIKTSTIESETRSRIPMQIKKRCQLASSPALTFNSD